MLIKDIPQPPMAAAPYHDILKPETELEHQFLKAPEFVSGLHWGTPRYGHPEGEVMVSVYGEAGGQKHD